MSTTTLYLRVEDAKRAALAQQQADQCAAGRHVFGCPHRPATLPVWMRRNNAKVLG